MKPLLKLPQGRSAPINSKKRQYYMAYTAVFAVLALFVFSVFVYYGKTFVQNEDAYNQHYKALVYYGKFLRNIVKTLVYEHTLNLDLYNFGIGFGGDVLTTLHYYCIGDPLTILTVFVPTSYMPYFYGALYIIRLYLAGVAFSAFALYVSEKGPYTCGRRAVLAGAIVYVFSGFALCSLDHPFFTNAMIYLPLVILGTEKVIRRDSPVMLMLAVCFATLSNFYLLYMIAVFTVIYVAWRVLASSTKKGVKHAFALVGRMVIYAGTGVAMGAVILLPMILAYCKGSRSDATYVLSALYSSSDYEDVFGAILTVVRVNEWTCLGFAGVALVAVCVLFMEKRYKSLRALFLVLTALILVPLAGKVLNGFSYVSNRWTFAYAFFVAYMVTATWHTMASMNRKKKAIVAAVICFYAIACVVITNAQSIGAFFGIAMAFMALVTLALATDAKSRNYGELALLAVVAVNVCGNGFIYFSSDMDRYNTVSELNDTVTGSEIPTLTAATYDDDEAFYRYSGSSITLNQSIYTGYAGTSFYWSIFTSNLNEFRNEMGFAEGITWKSSWIDSRTFVSALTNVKYYSQAYNLPYGFSRVVTTADYCVAENELYLPFGYTYSTVISRADYDDMTEAEKQEAMMQGVVLEGDSVTTDTYVDITSYSIEYTVEDSDTAIFEDGSITVTEADSTVTLYFDGPADCETYLYIKGLSFDETEPIDRYSDEEWEALTTYEKKLVLKEQKNYSKTLIQWISTTCVKESGSITTPGFHILDPDNDYYCGERNVFLNYGYSDIGKVSITIKFPAVGTYTFDALEIICQPMDNYESQVAALAEDTMENLDFHNDNTAYVTSEVTGTISLSESKYLLLTIPYEDGWTAYVDGEECEILQANTMWMALYLEAGEHEIELRYETPGLKAGACVSIFALLIFLLLCYNDFNYGRGRHMEDI